MGVCYVTALAGSGDDVEALVVRMVMTHDVGSDETTTRYAIGPAAAGTSLRDWMTEMCGPPP